MKSPELSTSEGVRFAAAFSGGAVILAAVRRDGSPSGLREALASGWQELALYVAAGAIYIAIGVAAPEFLFMWAVAVGYLLGCVVVLPFLVRRVRGRAR